MSLLALSNVGVNALTTENIEDALPLALNLNAKTTRINAFLNAIRQPEELLAGMIESDQALVESLTAGAEATERALTALGQNPDVARAMALKEAQAIFQIKKSVQDSVLNPEELLEISLRKNIEGIDKKSLDKIIKQIVK